MSGIQSHPNRERMCVPLIRCVASLAVNIVSLMDMPLLLLRDNICKAASENLSHLLPAPLPPV
jgi:hypothetical protein